MVRAAEYADIPAILSLAEAAKGIMRSNGNMNQWGPGYPNEEVLRMDIDRDGGRMIERDGVPVAYFAYLASPEPTYSRIDGGAWLDDTMSYHVIHRIASTPDSHGVFEEIMEYAFCQDPNIRIDTHKDNTIMQHLILKSGFSYCGIIYLLNGDERLAYQKIAL